MIRKSVSLLSVAVVLAWVAPAQAANSIKATVNGMVCAYCAQGIEKRLSKMDATKAVFVDLKGKTVVVELKDGMSIDQKALTAEISDAGYDVIKVEPTQKSVDEFKAERKARK
jgi:copper chaperone CopZ